MNRFRCVLFFAMVAFSVYLPGAHAGEFSWTGFYVGGTIGGNFTSYDVPLSSDTLTFFTPNRPPTTIMLPVAGLHKTDAALLGGGQLGYNVQWGPFVLGVEGDFSGTSSEVSQPFVIATTLVPLGTLSGERTVESSWMASARLRAGFAVHAVMFYATGGGAFSDITVSAKDSFTGGLQVNSSVDNTATGWTVGGGVEWAITKAVSVGLEYRHADFGSNSYTFSGSQIVPHSLNAGVRTDQALFRVNLLFNGLMGK